MMILNNVNIQGHDKAVNIKIENGKISEINPQLSQDDKSHLQFTFDRAVAFPGLINSHDHLDFNLFPQFGSKIYDNYTEWGKYIHNHYSDEIAGILKIPVLLRERWGVYKNLLSGVTTVVNHGKKSEITNKLISVLEKNQSLHSVQFEKSWKKKLNNPFKISQPVVIHTGEGTDKAAHREIDALIRWNLLKRPLIGIHGVALSVQQARFFKALVWCPESNFFLLDTTAAINELKHHTKILFGTDSTLTGNWNIWKQIRLARSTRMLTDLQLYQSLTSEPAQFWKLNTGKISENLDADLLIVKAKDEANGLNAFFTINPADILMVMHRGKVRLFDESLQHQFKSAAIASFSKISIDGSCKYIEGDLPQLMREIKAYQPAAKFPISLNEGVDGL